MSSSTPDTDRNLPYHMHLDAAGDEDVHVTVAKAVAAARNRDPAADRPLYDYVEPEALERLYGHAQRAEAADWEFSFSVDDLTVTLDSDGQIVVA